MAVMKIGNYRIIAASVALVLFVSLLAFLAVRERDRQTIALRRELADAIKAGSARAVICAVDRGADANLAWDESEENIPFSFRLMRLFRRMGGQRDERFSTKAPPLLRAACRGNRAVIEALLQCGARLNGTDDIGQTALIVAAVGENRDAVELLLSHRADVNVVDKEGSTALMEAALRGNTGIVRSLLDAGADPALVHSSGRTALDYAKLSGSNDCVVALVKSIDAKSYGRSRDQPSRS